jgi:hypothetical protein
MKTKAFLILLSTISVVVLLGVASTQAKPHSYVGGTMAMQENDETGHTISLDHTFTPMEAVGLYVKQDENGKQILMISPQINTLLKRWNLPDGQGNIFNMSGFGVAYFRNDTQPAAWTAFLADYESRRFFASYEPRFVWDGDIEKSVWQRARLGVAPYLANYNDLNTWLMFQVDHHPAKNDHFVATPLIRLFYKTYLFEVGYSSTKHVMVNWTVQF